MPRCVESWMTPRTGSGFEVAIVLVEQLILTIIQNEKPGGNRPAFRYTASSANEFVWFCIGAISFRSALARLRWHAG